MTVNQQFDTEKLASLLVLGLRPKLLTFERCASYNIGEAHSSTFNPCVKRAIWENSRFAMAKALEMGRGAPLLLFEDDFCLAAKPSYARKVLDEGIAMAASGDVDLVLLGPSPVRGQPSLPRGPHLSDHLTRLGEGSWGWHALIMAPAFMREFVNLPFSELGVLPTVRENSSVNLRTSPFWGSGAHDIFFSRFFEKERKRSTHCCRRIVAAAPDEAVFRQRSRLVQDTEGWCNGSLAVKFVEHPGAVTHEAGITYYEMPRNKKGSQPAGGQQRPK